MNGIIPDTKALEEIILGLSERIYIYKLFWVYSKRFQNISPVLETQRKPQDINCCLSQRGTKSFNHWILSLKKSQLPLRIHTHPHTHTVFVSHLLKEASLTILSEMPLSLSH